MAVNVVRITDENGDVVGAREYDAFGNVLSETGDWSMCDFGFQSNWTQVKDSGGDLYVTPGGRIYETRVGRFLQKDPVSPAPNPYDYALQDPLRYAYTGHAVGPDTQHAGPETHLLRNRARQYSTTQGRSPGRGPIGYREAGSASSPARNGPTGATGLPPGLPPGTNCYSFCTGQKTEIPGSGAYKHIWSETNNSITESCIALIRAAELDGLRPVLPHRKCAEGEHLVVLMLEDSHSCTGGLWTSRHECTCECDELNSRGFHCMRQMPDGTWWHRFAGEHGPNEFPPRPLKGGESIWGYKVCYAKGDADMTTGYRDYRRCKFMCAPDQG